MSSAASSNRVSGWRHQVLSPTLQKPQVSSQGIQHRQLGYERAKFSALTRTLYTPRILEQSAQCRIGQAQPTIVQVVFNACDHPKTLGISFTNTCRSKRSISDSPSRRLSSACDANQSRMAYSPAMTEWGGCQYREPGRQIEQSSQHHAGLPMREDPPESIHPLEYPGCVRRCRPPWSVSTGCGYGHSRRKDEPEFCDLRRRNALEKMMRS